MRSWLYLGGGASEIDLPLVGHQASRSREGIALVGEVAGVEGEEVHRCCDVDR